MDNLLKDHNHPAFCSIASGMDDLRVAHAVYNAVPNRTEFLSGWQGSLKSRTQ